MNRLFIALILVCILMPVAAAQDTLWTRTYGGTQADIGRRIRCTSDGGFIVVGDTYSFGAGERDLLLYKMDANGDSVWSKVYGGAFNEIGLWVEETSDGGYIVSGRTETWGQSPINIWIMKTDGQGDSLWSKVYWKGDHYNFGSAICQFDDSSYIAACGQGPYSTLDLWLLKLNLYGDTLWTVNYNPSGWWDEPYSMYKTAESDIIIGGLGFSMSLSWQGLIMKIDSTGSPIWTKFYGGNEDDRIYDVKQTMDGGYIAAGYTTSFGAGDKDAWVLRMDSNGDTLWSKTYGGSAADMGQEIFETYDGGFLLAGYTNSFGAGENDVWILNLDSSGDSLWTQTFGGTANDYALALDNTDKNEPVVVGHTESYGIGESDIYLLKLRADYCLECYTTNFTPRIRSGGGTLIWDLTVKNCGNKTVAVYGEIYPTIGDCVTGYQFDLDLTRQITP
ncbi:MAG: hypothetical protein GF307_10000, partial [candidate division Zixibacteria bacterium]|nr:hypothetical protein [candidate division Zixibacteria bacterium]